MKINTNRQLLAQIAVAAQVSAALDGGFAKLPLTTKLRSHGAGALSAAVTLPISGAVETAGAVTDIFAVLVKRGGNVVRTVANAYETGRMGAAFSLNPAFHAEVAHELNKLTDEQLSSVMALLPIEQHEALLRFVLSAALKPAAQAAQVAQPVKPHAKMVAAVADNGIGEADELCPEGVANGEEDDPNAPIVPGAEPSNVMALSERQVNPDQEGMALLQNVMRKAAGAQPRTT